MAVPAAAAEHQPRQHRDQLEGRELRLARGAVRRRGDDRLAARDAPEHDVEERADAEAEGEDEGGAEDDELDGQVSGLSAKGWVKAK